MTKTLITASCILGMVLSSAAQQEICLVTVDSSSTENIVVWEKPISLSVDSFRVYREDTSFKLLATVAQADLSEYHDTGVDPNQGSSRYKISQIDTSGVETILSAPHSTMHLTVTDQAGDKLLTWTAYEGFPIAAYRVLVDTSGLGVFNLLTTVPNVTLNYSHISPPTSAGLDYVVEVLPVIPCISSMDNPGQDKASLEGDQKPASSYNSSRSNKVDGLSATSGMERLETKMTSVQIFPNPCMGNLKLKVLSSIEKLLSVTVYGPTGDRILHQDLGNRFQVQIDLNDLPGGLYFIQVHTTAGTDRRLIVLQ